MNAAVVDTLLLTLAALVGLAVGPLLADVAKRVLMDPAPPLVTSADAGVALRFGGSDRSMADRVVQISTAALFVALAVAAPSRASIPAYWWFAVVTVVVTLTDVASKLIPNRITLPGGLVGGGLLVAASVVDRSGNRLLWALIGAAAYFTFMLILALIVPGGLGFGDVKLAPILGAYLGFSRPGFVVLGIVAAYVIGGVVSLLLLVTRIKGRKDAIPFGPYMVVGAYCALFFGHAIIDWYLP